MRTVLVIGVLLLFLAVIIVLIWWSWPEAHHSATGHYKHAAVASDAPHCSSIGKDIMYIKNGSAADAAVATLLCLGIHSAMSCGIGGGFQVIVYDRPHNGSAKVMKVFDAREVAPKAATKDMFVNGSSDTYGGKAIAVPGEIKGYYEVWKQFGRLPWRDLFTPTIDLCRNGFPVGWALARFISLNEAIIRNNSGLQQLFVKPDGSLYKEGDVMKRPRLAETLKKIQDNPDALYEGSLAEDIVEEIKGFGGIVTSEDLKDYRVLEDETLKLDLEQSGHRLHTLRPPSSGVLFGFMLRILEGFNLTSENIDGTRRTVETYHKIVETFKFGYAMRSYLGDEKFVDIKEIMKNLTSYDFANYIRSKINLTHTQNVSYYHPEFSSNSDRGTSHLSIISPDGGAVSATTTINSVFGSKMVGKRTGIIYNDEMADFVTPGRSALGKENYIEPGKRPMSSMCPSIVVDRNDDVVLVIGAAGGKQITSASVFVAAHNLWLGKKVDGAVDALRVHHQLEPDEILYEPTFPQGIVNGLKKKGHVLVLNNMGFPSVVQLVKSHCHEPDAPENCLFAVCDYRKKGKPDGF